MQLYIKRGIDPDSNRQRKQLAGGGSKTTDRQQVGQETKPITNQNRQGGNYETEKDFSFICRRDNGNNGVYRMQSKSE